MPYKTFFIEKYHNNVGYIYNINDFNLQNVKGDDDFRFRYISLQIFV